MTEVGGNNGVYVAGVNKAKMAKQSMITKQGITVIIPTYNGSSWLPSTLQHVEAAIKDAKLEKYEVLFVNDGSTDDTLEVIASLQKKADYPIRVVTQKNGGRFVARRTGTNEAKYPNLLFVDTRVYIGKTSLSYLISKHQADQTRNVWCSHVRVDKKGNIYARFWETVAFVAWRKYFKQPRDISYGIAEFDDYPKGTTCFFITKSILADANQWFEKNTKDLKTSNDDTLLLRYVAQQDSINISPDFWCLYHARSTMKQYTKHVYHRGQVFVDGFLRNDGNRFFIPLIVFLILSIVFPIVLVLWPGLLTLVFVAFFAGLALELLTMLLIGVPSKDAVSTMFLSPVFAVYYGAGIWKAFIKIFIVRKSGVAT